jgi:HTH-type transcriptional regulator / antitoxin HigA
MRQKMVSREAPPLASDSYLECVRKFPLKPIRDESLCREAVEVLGRLAMRTDLDAGEQDYLDALSHFVGDYEKNFVKFKAEPLAPLEALKYLMEENDMSVTDLGYVVGSRGLASEILSGKRGLSKAVIQRLAKRFCVSPSLFLG